MRDQKRTIPRLLLFIAVLTWAGFTAFLRAHSQAFAIDEFTYAHAAWMIHHGEEPYRDFFFHHFPFSMQLWSVRLSEGMSSEEVLTTLRDLMVVSFVVCLFCQSYLLRSFGIIAQLSVMLFSVACVPFRGPALELRPDAIGFSLVLMAGALLSYSFEKLSRSTSRLRIADIAALLSGALLVLAIWSSEKVLFYAAPLFLFALFVHWAEGKTHTIWCFVSGAGMLAMCIFAWLISRGLLADWFRWGILWQMLHEMLYPLREVKSEVLILLREWWWFGALAFSGLVLRRNLTVGQRNVIRLLYVGIALSGTSYLMQRGAYYYSLLPLFGLLAMLSAASFALWINVVFSKLNLSGGNRRSHAETAVGAMLFIACLAAPRHFEDHTRSQLEFLARVEERARPDECVYDNTGIAVARPSAHYFYYTDKLARLVYQSKLETEIPVALDQKKCPVMIKDRRFMELSPALQQSLTVRYRELTPQLWLLTRDDGVAPVK